MPKSHSYILAVGEDGSQRLATLHRLLSPSTQGFFKTIGLKEGQKVLEIGCGTGNVTALMANIVGSDGQVVAIDISQEQIDVAKNQMALRNINNVKFFKHSIVEPLPFFDAFDVVYSRLTIMHVSDPGLALNHMYSALRKDGILACEEASNAHYTHDPYNAAYDRSRILLLELSKKNGMDPVIGDKLFTYFHQLGLRDIEVEFIQPVYAKEEMSAIPQFFDEVKQNYIRHQMITEEEAALISEQIKMYIQNDSPRISFPQIAQIHGKK